MTFKQDDHKTPVLFRVSRAEKTCGSDVTAIFPCEPADRNGFTMTCYAHIGQHGACDESWYRTTRPALPSEYESLKRELESAPYGYRFKIYRRMQPRFRAIRFAEARRIRQAIKES